jgi:hypothetical protein
VKPHTPVSDAWIDRLIEDVEGGRAEFNFLRAPDIVSMAREVKANRSRDKRLGAHMTPIRRLPPHGKHVFFGHTATVLAVCPAGTNGILNEGGVLVLLMPEGRVFVDAAENWRAC